jgi:hypothetical protein
MTLYRFALAAALAATLLTPVAATGHTDRKHDGLVWILKENCHSTGKPSFTGRFKKNVPEKVTVVADFDGDMKRATRKVSAKGRFVVEYGDMPERVRIRWRDRNGDVHSTGWRGPFHNGCNEQPPEPPPGVPDNYIPSYSPPPGHTTCGDNSGVACIETWIPPPPGWPPAPPGPHEEP